MESKDWGFLFILLFLLGLFLAALIIVWLNDD